MQELEAQFGELLPEREALGCFGRAWNPCHHHVDPCKPDPCKPVHCHPKPEPCAPKTPPPCAPKPPCEPQPAPCYPHHHGHHDWAGGQDWNRV